MQTETNRIRKEITKSELTLRRDLYKSQYQKEGTLTAELSQMVETTSFYPTQAVSSNLQDNLFNTSQFTFKEQEYTNKEMRISWIDVPENMNKEDVEIKLKEHPEATLYRILSNKPILSDNEQQAVSQGLVVIDTFANRQVVRYPKGNKNEGKLYLDPTGKIQYRRIAFNLEGKEDQDFRTKEEGDYYISKELEIEMNNTKLITESQTI